MIILGVVLLIVGLLVPAARICLPIGCVLIAVALILYLASSGAYSYY